MLESIQKIKFLMKSKQYETANSEIDELLKEFPEKVELLFLKGLVFFEMSSFDNAIDIFNRLIAKNSSELKYFEALLKAYRGAKRSEDMQAIIESIISLEPHNRLALVYQVELATEAKDWLLTQGLIDNALVVYPDDYWFLIRKGIVFRQLGETGNSISVLEYLRLIQPSDTFCIIQLSLSYKENRRYEQGLASIQRCLEINPKLKQARQLEIEFLILTGDNASALASSVKARQEFQQDQVFLDKHIQSLRLLGKKRELIELLEDVCSQDKCYFRYLNSLLFLYKEQKEYDNIEKMIAKIIKLNLTTVDDSLMRLKMLVNIFRLDSADKLSIELYQEYRDSENVQLIRYQILNLMGQYSEAQTLYSNCKKIKLDLWVMEQVDAFCLQNDFSSAINELLNYLINHQYSTAICTKLLAILFYLGLYDKCIQVIKYFSDSIDVINKSLFEKITYCLFTTGNSIDSLYLLTLLCNKCPQHYFGTFCWILKGAGFMPKAIEYVLNYFDKAENKDVAYREIAVFYESNELSFTNRISPSYRTNKVRSGRYINFEKFLNSEFGSFSSLDPYTLAMPKKYGQKNIQNSKFNQLASISNELSNISLEFTNLDQNALNNLMAQIVPASMPELENLVCQKKPFVIVSSHLGVPGTLIYLTNKFEQLHYLISHGVVIDKQNWLSERAISLGGNFESTKRLFNIVNNGGSVLSTLDQSPELIATSKLKNTLKGSLFGISVEFSTFLSRFIWSKKLPSFWVQLGVVDGKITLDYIPCPNPTDFDSKLDWENKWIKTCCDGMEKVIGLSPLNVVPNSSLWRRLAKGEHADAVNSITHPIFNAS
jgi:tetratricopeptide (TPR) repeat protein